MYLKKTNGNIIGEGSSLRLICEAHHENLSDANLHSADLSHAELDSTDLSFANLRKASLYNANLSFAKLEYANLSDADLSRADFGHAELRNVRRGNYVLKNAPIQIYNSEWEVLIFNEHMEIGVAHMRGLERHSFEKWEEFTNEDIIHMFDEDVYSHVCFPQFWNENKSFFISSCEKQSKII